MGELLVKMKLISRGQLERALAEQKVTHKRLGEILLGMRVVSSNQLHEVLVEQRAIDHSGQAPDSTLQSVRQVVDQILSTGCITRIDQELLMSILLSKASMRLEECQLVEQIFDRLQRGKLKVV
jgi:hypothetical protein